MEHERQGGQTGEAPTQPQKCSIDERRTRQRAHKISVEEGKPEVCALGNWLWAKWELEQAPDPKD